MPGLLRAIERGEREGVDGYVIACFGDPGLDAAREIARGPVVGIAEAAMHTASHLGRGFSVVTTLARTMGRAADLAEHYGMQRFCLGIHACEIAVLDLDTDPDARKIVTEACRDAVETDGSRCRGARMRRNGRHVRADLRRTRRSRGRRCYGRDADRAVAGRHGAGYVKRGEFAAPPPKDYTFGG